MARILYVTPIWEGLKESFVEGGLPKGMPGFVKPLRLLLERGFEVDFLIATDRLIKPKPNKEVWGTGRMELVKYLASGRSSLLGDAFRLSSQLKRLLIEDSYAFVYGQGQYLGAIANWVANRYDVPFGQRCYGTFLATRLENLRKGRRLRKLRSWAGLIGADLLELANYRLAKRFLLVTDDGSKGDVLYRRFGCPRYEWCFWRNGVDFSDEVPELFDLCKYGIKEAESFIVYPARIQGWKRQDRMVEILARLKGRLATIPRVIFPGQFSPNDPYYQEVLTRARDSGVLESINFPGGLSQAELRFLYGHPNCLCAASFYDNFNLGNAIMEAFAYGTIIVSYRNSGLDWLVNHGQDGFLVNDIAEVDDIIVRLAEDRTFRRRLQKACRIGARANLETWSQRARREVDLIERSVFLSSWPSTQVVPMRSA